jgi:hypothetical protein
VLVGAVYLIPLFGQNLSLSGTVGSLFMKNTVFLFGHNMVNLTIYLGAGCYLGTREYVGNTVVRGPHGGPHSDGRSAGVQNGNP